MREGLSLQERLYRWLKTHPEEWVNGGELERLAMQAGYKGSTAGRELRFLSGEEKGYVPIIQKEARKDPQTGVRSNWYRYSAELDYQPVDEREADELARVLRKWPDYYPKYVEMLRYWHSLPELSPRKY